MKKGGTNKINKRLKNKGLHLYIENEFFVKTVVVPIKMLMVTDNQCMLNMLHRNFLLALLAYMESAATHLRDIQ